MIDEGADLHRNQPIAGINGVDCAGRRLPGLEHASQRARAQRLGHCPNGPYARGGSAATPENLAEFRPAASSWSLSTGMKPISRGSIHLTRPNAFDPPKIEANDLADPRDLKDLTIGSDEPVRSNEALKIGLIEVPGRRLALCVGPKRCRVAGRPAGPAPPGPPTPADLQRFSEIAHRYGHWLGSLADNAAVGISFG